MRTLVAMPEVLSSPLIRILPEQLANQIAAGEVVERPASVVKELMENSLDAGATQIDVEIEAGGLKKILVRDNGCGIAQAQLPLALCRHATSKIASIDDLQAIDSLGFRGEALASIGSVSRLQLISRCAGADSAWCLATRPGVDQIIEPIAHPPGTSVDVGDLFYNTPARRKFLRAERTEFRHLDEVFRRMALGRFDVGFQLKHNQRYVHQLRPAVDNEARLRRLHKLFGKAFVQQGSYVQMQASGLRVWGWLSRPDYLRSQTDQQYFYVNGRIIRDRMINHAIRQAYQPWLYPGRQAAYVLHLELDEALVDVNVHPTKHEVRFRESRLVHDFIYTVVSGALAPTTATPAALQPAPVASRDAAAPPAATPQVREAVNPYGHLRGLTTETHEPTPLGMFLGALANRFWLFAPQAEQAEQAEGLLVLDLPAAREQVYLQRLRNTDAPLSRQPVLVPMNLSLTPAQFSVLTDYHEQFEAWGIDVRITGPQSAMVFHLPGLLRGVDAEPLLLDLLMQWTESLPGEQSQRQQQLATLAARHFRPQARLENRSQWLQEVADLPASAPPVWRLLDSERLAALVRRG
ncbi:MAG: DNA mismatch repair endonuclease MutL [Gammaproteobacteria bacterium]